ncbi:MAG: MlaD family protein [Solirubrobacterales bacterium]
MRRLALIVAVILSGAGSLGAVAGADDVHTYRIEMYNAFGLVVDSNVRVAGVTVGRVADLSVNDAKRAVVTVELTGDLARLGDETECESSPQSLLAEYYLDCQPAGEPLPEGGLIPASRVQIAIQPDLVANTFREPYRERLTLLVNEFGTALAGNPENLREAIRLGAPALTELEEVTAILAEQTKSIRDLNVNSERVSGELARYREQVVDFVDEAEDLASTALERREDVSRGFDLFDDYIAELRPTLAQLNDTATEQAPFLAALREAAPELYRLTQSLPPFQRASEDSLVSLGDAAVVGERALRHGEDELELLARAGRPAPETAEILADFLSDLDDPRRAVEINDLAGPATGRTGERPGTRQTMGYTGFEGLLNYPYYQALALNQFDRGGHALHINLYEAFSGPCGSFSSGRDLNTGAPGIPAEAGGTTTDFADIAPCSTWLGPNQPGINEDLGLAKYDPGVCPSGTAPEHARTTLCDPNDPKDSRRAQAGGGAGAEPRSDRAETDPRAPDGQGPPGGGLPLPDPSDLPPRLEDLLDNLGGRGLDTLGQGGGGGGDRPRGGGATEDLLDYLLRP